MAITHVSETDLPVQSSYVHMTVGTIQHFHRSVGPLHGNVAAKFLRMNRPTTGMQRDVGVRRHLYHIFNDATVLVGSSEQMRNQTNAIVTLALVNLDLVGMEDCRDHHTMWSTSGNRDRAVLIVDRDRRVLSNLEAQVFADGGPKCHASQR